MPAKNLTRINDQAIYLHIYNRGVEGRTIFESPADYQVFLAFLKDYLTPQDPSSLKKDFKVHGRTFKGTPHLPKNYFNQVELIAYSLTADRFDLILHQETRGSIERFLRSLCTRYSMYFNKKYRRSGSLFEGPYKSIVIEDISKLPQLTRYLHHNHGGDYSSYPEYLGSRNTVWVKPQIVLSSFKGTDDYKNFVEKYQADQNEKEVSDDVTFGSESDHLERSYPTSVRSRMPQFLAISGVGFVFLVSFSLWNINSSKALSNLPLPTPEVLSETKATTPSTTPEASSAAIVEATTAATLEATAAAVLEAAAEKKTETLRVKIGDGSSYVNIRQKPTINSEKIGQANDGDILEFVSLKAGWYEIKLTDETSGFISAKYAVKEKEAN